MSSPYNKTAHDIISANIQVPKVLLISNIAFSIFYLVWWFNLSHVGNPLLYTLLFIGEVYHVWQSIGYTLTIWNQKKTKAHTLTTIKPVDVFITVCGEPAALVEKTVMAATSMDYQRFRVFVLNDGKSRKIEGWEEIDTIARKYRATPITRDINEGNKAGNVNNALRLTSSPFIAVFDADHVPHKDFLKKTMGAFNDNKVAIVQTPQYYTNNTQSSLTNSAWEQQELFFGPICRGKNNLNSVFWCGTNALIRRKALDDIGGVPVNNIAEDFLATFYMHEKGWKSVYIPEILAEGLAPHNLANYVTQQFRWARGSSEIIFHHNLIFNKKLTLSQKIQYLHSATYYLNGFMAVIDGLIPILALLTGVVPVLDKTGAFMVFFLPFMLSTVLTLMESTSNTITFNAIQMSVSTSFVFISAIISTLFKLKSPFKVTKKEEESGNFLRFAIPNITYAVLGITTIVYAFTTRGLTSSTVTNASWIVFNSVLFAGYIGPAYDWKSLLVEVWQKVLSIKYKPVHTLALSEKGHEKLL